MLNEIDLSRTDLNLLVLFEVVLKERHVGRAAQRLSLSPSAVSHGLARLRRLFKDPLFLRTPKGVVPSERATQLAQPIADVLARVRHVVSTAEPFEATRSTRRFTIGAPDGLSAAFLPPLVAVLRGSAPSIGLSLLELLPADRVRSSDRTWERALADLEARAMDVAVLPLDHVPARFVARLLYEDDFVIAMRAGHAFADKPTLSRFCEMQHLVVSLTGDAFGFVDEILARCGRSRRIALTVPTFMVALAMIAETDLIAAVPRRLISSYAQRFEIVQVEPPIALPRFPIQAIVPQPALMDSGVAWLLETVENAMKTKMAAPQGRRLGREKARRR